MSVSIQKKIRRLKIRGSKSKVPVQVKIAELINEGKAKILTRLLQNTNTQDGYPVRVVIRPQEFVKLQERVRKKSSKYAEPHPSQIFVSLRSDDDEDERLVRMYRTFRKVEKSQIERLICTVQIIDSKVLFSCTITHCSLSQVLSRIPGISIAEVQDFNNKLREAWHTINARSKPESGTGFIYVFKNTG